MPTFSQKQCIMSQLWVIFWLLSLKSQNCFFSSSFLNWLIIIFSRRDLWETKSHVEKPQKSAGEITYPRGGVGVDLDPPPPQKVSFFDPLSRAKGGKRGAKGGQKYMIGTWLLDNFFLQTRAFNCKSEKNGGKKVKDKFDQVQKFLSRDKFIDKTIGCFFMIFFFFYP